MGRPWIAFFSQTGSEIEKIATHLNRWPDVIITNKRPDDVRTITESVKLRAIEIPNKPTLEEYMSCLIWHENPIVTLHGWLRIIPPRICDEFDVYNGHPGLITKYPELKGKDPQMRAWNGDYSTYGTVIHKVSEGVDEGGIINTASFTADMLDIDGYFRILNKMSQTLWIDFLRGKI